ncbi:Panacea domain-containing protein [Corynebacterium pseudodiphtheriticum]|uniref:Panacea domain-containing protein n=1 Tax=Corynebacterium TaxID=1716 RepID=UPI00254C735F|nr:Panacea domain-containing protein [Corynebacterium pseudodiphtheriticum]MDK8718954.1 Panacea domain-containing protein [Corynebacterium pseudodiphtheriticum]MDK8762014.1 Panacea domain-containing protein [Corynebacterium pseudodiphtheriticum]
MSVRPSISAVKAAQAVNFFLQESTSDPKSVDGNKYLKLIKLLWAADRFSLRNFGSEVTEDKYSAMPYGPVASKTYDLIKACKPGGEVHSRWRTESDGAWWKDHFETCDYEIESIADPGSDYLSRADILMLETAYNQFRGTNRFATANNISHIYPEWTRSFVPNVTRKSFEIDPLDFFDDPENQPDPYFEVDPETLESARYFFNVRQDLSTSIGIAL